MESDPTIPDACPICHDNRWVTRSVEARTRDVYPCPCCGPPLLDSDGKFGVAGRRYGNQLLDTADAYFSWRARNRMKAAGWTEQPLRGDEPSRLRLLRISYPDVPEKVLAWWILGERRVYVPLPASREATL